MVGPSPNTSENNVIVHLMSARDDNDDFTTVESFRNGYPRFAALLSSDGAFQVFRRFARLRMRIILTKQDELALLENCLDKIDQEEQRALFLGNLRRDSNEQRKAILERISAALSKYGMWPIEQTLGTRLISALGILDDLLEQSCRILRLGCPADRDAQSLRNWFNGNNSVARAETAYLSKSRDLMSLCALEDDAPARLGNFVEDALVWIYQVFRANPKADGVVSEDPHVFVSTGAKARVAVRCIVAWLIIVLLLVPVIVLKFLRHFGARMLTILFATAALILFLLLVSRAKMSEILIAGATYSAVLVVFVAGTSNNAG